MGKPKSRTLTFSRDGRKNRSHTEKVDVILFTNGSSDMMIATTIIRKTKDIGHWADQDGDNWASFVGETMKGRPRQAVGVELAACQGS
jgi:hypothetical protein